MIAMLMQSERGSPGGGGQAYVSGVSTAGVKYGHKNQQVNEQLLNQ